MSMSISEDTKEMVRGDSTDSADFAQRMSSDQNWLWRASRSCHVRPYCSPLISPTQLPSLPIFNLALGQKQPRLVFLDGNTLTKRADWTDVVRRARVIYHNASHVRPDGSGVWNLFFPFWRIFKKHVDFRWFPSRRFSSCRSIPSFVEAFVVVFLHLVFTRKTSQEKGKSRSDKKHLVTMHKIQHCKDMRFEQKAKKKLG